MTTLTVRADGAYRDLNGHGRMDPFENPTLSAEERAVDLLQRLSLEEKVGLLFHTVIEVGPDGDLRRSPVRSAMVAVPPTALISARAASALGG